MVAARHLTGLFISLCLGAQSDRAAAPDTPSENEAFIKVITVFPKENRGFYLLDVPNPPPGDHIGRYFDPARHHFLINGGYFNADYSPTGYFKISGKVLKVITEAMDLYDVATKTKRAFPGLERLLNLDGGPSTAVKTSDFELRNASPVRNYLCRSIVAEQRRKSPATAFETEPENPDF